MIALAASLLAFSAILMAAMGSHLFDMKGLQDSFKIASNMHLFNSAGLLGLAALLVNHVSGALKSGAWLIVLGTVVFCGSIYLHVITGHSIPAVTPAGGMLMMAGWLLAALAFLRRS
jgi:uncharacterized membrane protein YgdD (TMEM256/DUF423 family)